MRFLFFEKKVNKFSINSWSIFCVASFLLDEILARRRKNKLEFKVSIRRFL
jgi:hypothetical protein